MKRKVVLVIILLLIAIGIFYWPNRWNYIVIHHSAGDYGNIEFLQDIHDQRQSREPIHAISYHYAIGNGNGMEDGKIGSDIRKKYNLWGVHVSRKNPDRNFRGLGICIIGNLDNKAMTDKQYESLLNLTMKLMEDYHIDIDHVGFHGKIQGETTKCPGKYFPYDKFQQDLNEKLSY